MVEDSTMPERFLNRSTRTVLAAAGHEMRAPLHTMLGMAELLQQSPLSSTQRQYLESLQRAGASLSTLIDRFVARQTPSQLNTHCDLLELADEVMELVAADAFNKDIRLLVDVPATLPTAVVGDQVRLRQIFINLMSNALKFTDQGTVTLRMRADDDTADKTWFHFSVIDTGPGVPQALHAQLFRPWKRLPGSEHTPGMGLGLSIVHRILQALGGSIRVESPLHEGRGTAFHVSVPLQVAPYAKRRTGDEWEALKGMRVLLLGDEELTSFVSLLLLNREAIISVATNMDDALAAMQSAAAPFDAVLGYHQDISALLLRAPSRTSKYIAVVPRSKPVDTAAALDGAGAFVLLAPVRRMALYEILRGMKQAAVAPVASSLLQGLCVYAVDDSDDARGLLHHHLQGVGLAQLAIFATGAELVSAVSTVAPTDRVCVLIDIEMPEQDGFAVAHAVGRRVPLVSMSAHRQEDLGQWWAMAGFRDHLPKPFTAASLHQLLVKNAARPQLLFPDRALRTEALLALARRDYRAIELLADRLASDEQTKVMRLCQARDEVGLWDWLRSWDEQHAHPTSPSSAPAPVNVEAGMEDLVATYVARRLEDVAEISVCLQTAQHERIGFLAHRMAGSGGSFGLPLVTELGRELERHSKAHNRAASEEAMKRLKQHLLEVQQQLGPTL
jgi:CheY-like chemotaxis protein/two-component sensor histidine kinase